MKNNCIFAASQTKRTKNISVDGIYYARLDACICKDKEAVQIPAAVIEICQFSWSRMGGGQPFLYFILNFSLAMTKRNENASTVNNSSRTNTSAHDTRKTFYTRFLTEKDAKNQAYHFILSHGLFDKFADYCRNVQVDDPHAACISILQTQIQEG